MIYEHFVQLCPIITERWKGGRSSRGTAKAVPSLLSAGKGVVRVCVRVCACTGVYMCVCVCLCARACVGVFASTLKGLVWFSSLTKKKAFALS